VIIVYEDLRIICDSAEDYSTSFDVAVVQDIERRTRAQPTNLFELIGIEILRHYVVPT
jgi:hypothetical protein